MANALRILQLRHLIVILALLSALVVGPAAEGAVGFSTMPAATSNTYLGPIVLLVTGLTNSESVVVQKFLDANSNGVVDAGDWLWQQFSLTDGTASVFTNGSIAVTNFNVPGDTDGTANGSITARLNQSGDFAQRVVGKYLFVVSSPAGHFSPLTSSFTVSNFPFPQQFTGNVLSSGSPVANALVLIGSPDSDGNLNLFAGTVANNSGGYSLQVVPGKYLLVAAKSNFVGSLRAVTNQVLASGATINTNLSLIPTTQSISGKVVDAANTSVGIPGFLQPVGSQSGLFGAGVTDSNGNFSIRVTADQWGLSHGSQAMMLHGYLTKRTNPSANTTTGSVSALSVALSKATALFYGSVKDPSGRPLPGVWIFDEDNINVNLYTNAGEGVTDSNGNYAAAALGGGSTWLLGIDNSLVFPGYTFSSGEQTPVGAGKAVRFDFTATPFVPDMSTSGFVGAGRFRVNASGVPGQNYTLQMSSNLSAANWSPLLITNLSTTSFSFTDSSATNGLRLYRVLVGPSN